MNDLICKLASGLKPDWKVLLTLAFLSGIPIGFVVIMHEWKGDSYAYMTRDISFTAGLKFYAGFLSQIGLFIWSGTFALLLFSKSVLYFSGTGKALFDFITASALITALLLLDDAFQLHEDFLPRQGVPEIIVYFSYALCIAVYLAVYFRVIIQTHFIYLLMAFGGFAGSILVDLIEPTFFDYLLLEDSFKFIGICCWMLYFWIYARKELAT